MKQEVACSHERSNVDLRVSSLPFSRIPNQSKLFLEYLRDPLSLSRYYPNAASDPLKVGSFIPTVLENYRTNRNALCNALSEINLGLDCGTRSAENIELLREPDTVAVVTGQQAGLFTGPLYTIYKALSAIKLAESLREQGAKAVPVFWAATEDHDFDEVSRAFVISRSGDLDQFEYSPANRTSDRPVGNIVLEGSIREVIDGVFASLAHTESTGDLRQLLEQAWAEGASYGRAFERELSATLRKYGLVFVDPMNKALKQLAAPIYIEAVERSDRLVDAIRASSSQLESEGFHAQVLVGEDYFPLFWHTDDGRRVALRRIADDLYRAKDEKRDLTRKELADIAANEPDRLSPGVMLRPVVQDHLLPTVCYFGGAAEIAYFAQNGPVYRILERPVTPIFHRQSFTVVEAKHRRTLLKFGLELQDMFGGADAALERVGREQIAAEGHDIFTTVLEDLNSGLDRLDEQLSGIDPTLSASLSKRRKKIVYHIQTLQKKAYLARARKDETLERQIRAAFASLLPNGELQERILNVNSFLNKYGPYFIDWIYETIDLNDKDHRIIRF